MSATETPESGVLPGRLEFVREPSYFGVPTDPAWQLYSDEPINLTADPGMAYSADHTIGSPDAADHDRETEDPSFEVAYKLQQALVDASDDPLDPAGDGMLRDSNGQLPNSHMAVHRRTYPGGNDGGGLREYTVMRGGKVSGVDADLDPGDNPIAPTVSYAPRKVRSYLIHQPSSSTTVEVTSTDDADTMDITIEDEGAATTETLTLTGTTSVTGTSSFEDIDAIWLADTPVGDITITDGGGTTLMEIKGGLSYSDDDQPVDGDRGVPILGSGSHASAIGSSFEHFVGDRFERPSGSAVRSRVNSASWSIENDFDQSNTHDSRHPLEDEGVRTAAIEATVSGKTTSHDNFVEHLTKDQQNLEHELSNTLITWNNTAPVDIDAREIDAEAGVSTYSVTFEASGDPAITLTQP